MDALRGKKLKRVLDSVPPGFLVDSKWLTENEIARNSTYAYRKAGWLERVRPGLYRRPFGSGERTDADDWRIAVLSAQWIMGHDFHVGGKTAFGLSGRTHYLSLGREADVYLYGETPSWLAKLDLTANLLIRTRRLFAGSLKGVEQEDFKPFSHGGESPWRWPIKASSPERAILEALDELPGRESFHTLDTLFEGLDGLRPRRITDMLVECRSVKAKRLFFLFAERHGHAWLKHIDRSKIDLGRGPRAIVEGGRLHSGFQLIVPPEFAGQEPSPNGS